MRYTRKKKIGGKYIAQGTYGCVFGNPPLKCIDEDARRNNSFVSKMMKQNDANSEVSEADLWKAIDPDQNFSLNPSKICKLDIPSIKIKNELNKCTLRYDKDDRTLILYKNGGKDLLKIVPKSSDYEPLFSGFQNLFDGLVIAHKNNICNTDIKPQNILSGTDKIHLRFIDFGLTVNTKELNYIDSMYANNEIYYPYWPFELGCFNNDGNLYTKKYVNKRLNEFNTKYSAETKDYGITNINIPIDTLYKILENTDFTDFKTIFEKVDVFSMGVVIIETVRKYFNHHPYQLDNGNYFIIYYHKENDKFSRFTTLKDKGWLSDKQLNYQLYLYNNLTIPLLNFAYNCIDFDPKRRYSAEQAANEYKKLLPIFKTHLKANEIRNGLAGLNILDEVSDIPIIPTPEKIPTPKPPTPKLPTPKPPTPKLPSLPVNNLRISPNSNKEEAPPQHRVTRKIKNSSIIPKTSAELDNIYKITPYYVSETDLLVKIARSLGSRKNYTGRTKIVVFNDIKKKSIFT